MEEYSVDMIDFLTAKYGGCLFPNLRNLSVGTDYGEGLISVASLAIVPQLTSVDISEIEEQESPNELFERLFERISEICRQLKHFEIRMATHFASTFNQFPELRTLVLSHVMFTFLSWKSLAQCKKAREAGAAVDPAELE